MGPHCDSKLPRLHKAFFFPQIITAPWILLGYCVSCLLLCNNYPKTYQLKVLVSIISRGFCRPEIQRQLNWGFLAWGFPGGCGEALARAEVIRSSEGFPGSGGSARKMAPPAVVGRTPSFLWLLEGISVPHHLGL